jgi:hypothetical protein
MAAGLGACATPETGAGATAARASLADPIIMASTASMNASFLRMIFRPPPGVHTNRNPGNGQPPPAHSADLHKDPAPKVLVN